MIKYLVFLLAPSLCFATSYIQISNTNWHNPAGFTPNGIPGFGDTISNSGYVLTCEASQICDLGKAGITSLTLGTGTSGASLIVNGTFTLRGTAALNGPARNCANAPAVTLATSSKLQLDEQSGVLPSGFAIGSGTSPCVIFTIGTAGDVCNWTPGLIACPTNVTSINNSAANGVLMQDAGSGYGDSVVNWHGVALNSVGSASTTVGAWMSDFYTANSSMNWSQVYLNASGWFGSNPTTGMGNSAITVLIDSTISVGRLGGTDFDLGGPCSGGAYAPAFIPACTGQRKVSNSLIRDMASDGAHSEPFTAGATVTGVYWDGLGTNYGSLAASNVAGGSWSYAVVASDAASCSENVSTNSSVLAPTADHIYAICTAAVGVPVLVYVPATSSWGTDINLTNFIFDNETSRPAHCLVTYGASQNGGFSVNMSYMTVLYNASLGGGGCGLAAWSASCPAAPVTSITHVVQPGTGQTGTFYACEGNSAVAVAPAISTYKANIFYDSAPRTDPVAFGNSNPAAQPANVLPPSGVDYNDNYNFVPFNPAPYSIACAAGCTNGGGPYAIPMTGTAPGAHDQTVNPRLLDNTRNSYTWAAMRGQPATAAGFRQVFINDGPSRIAANIAALFYYINQGNIPAQSLWNASPDGSTIGPSQPVMFGSGSFGIRKVTQ